MTEKKFYYINSEKLKETMSSKNMTYSRVAKLLGVSTKSIQRLINGTSLKIKANNLTYLSQILEVTQKDLILGNDDGIRIRPANLLIKALTSDHYYYRVVANQDWDNYIKILRSVSPLDLPNNQEVLLHFRLGLALLSTGAISSGIKTLEEGKQKSLYIKDYSAYMKNICALSSHYIPRVNFNDSLSTLQNIKDQYSNELVPIEKSFLYKRIGLTLLYKNQLTESILYLRKSIQLAYKDQYDSFLRVAIHYQFLGLAYLRNKDLGKAKSAYEKMSEFAIQSGWSQGKLLAKFYIALVEVMVGKADCIPPPLLRKAKNISKQNSYWPKTKFKQFELLNYIFTDQYENALKSYLEFRDMVKRSDYLNAHTTLTGLFFEKLSGMKIHMTINDIKKAQVIFKENNLHENLINLEWLLKIDRISKNDFIEKYCYLD